MHISLHNDYFFSGEVMMKYGIYHALVINRIIWSIKHYSENAKQFKKEFFIDDKWWVRDTYESLEEHFRGKIKARTIRKIVSDFERDGLLFSKKMNNKIGDQTKWYALNIAKWNEIHGVICHNMSNPDTSSDDASKEASLNDTSSSIKSKERDIIYNPDDKFGPVYENLLKVQSCQKNFQQKNYEPFLDNLLSEFSITIKDLINMSNEWQIYHNEPGGKKPQKPQASFRTWVKNTKTWRSNGRIKATEPQPGHLGEYLTEEQTAAKWARVTGPRC